VKVAAKSAALLLARDDDALLRQQISGETPLTVPAPRAFRSALAPGSLVMAQRTLGRAVCLCTGLLQLNALSSREAGGPAPTAHDSELGVLCAAHDRSAQRLTRTESALCVWAPVDVLAADRLADGDGRGRRGALGGWGSVDVRFGRGVRADSIDPNRMSGLPCIRDTRVTVSAVLGQLAAGLTIPEFLVEFPYLDRADNPGRLGVRRGSRAGPRAAPGPVGVASVRLPIDANLSLKVGIFSE
jgi:Protein of unknown function (DUF433)